MSAAARTRILERLRRAGSTSEAASARLASAGTQVSPVPSQGQQRGEAAIQQFIDKAIAADATASRIASLDDLPRALAEELRGRNLPAAIRTGEDPIFDRDW
ncbi:MAG: lactate utilization protein, partial [Pseudomonadota bacterium]